MTSIPPSRAGLRAMPGNAAYIIAEASQGVRDARRAEEAAGSAAAAAARRWSRILFYAQAAIAAALFLKWVALHSIVASAIMASIVFVLLTALQLFAGLFTAPSKRRLKAARQQLASARQQDVEQHFAGMTRGPYRWIRREGEYLAVFTDAGLLYHFGSASGERHLLLDASRAVKEVRVSVRTHTQTTTTSTTKHGRRLVVAPTDHVAVIGKGRSTTRTTTDAITTTAHVLEIQAQLTPGAQPAWIVIPFGSDGLEAENWRLLVQQAKA